MNFKKLKKLIYSYPKTKVMRILAGLGIIGATTVIFIKRDKIREIAEKVKNKFKKAA